MNRIQQLLASVFLIGVILACGAAAVVVALSLVQRRRVDVELLWEPRDLWVGAFIDTPRRCWYVCLLPTVLVKITWKP